MLVPKVLKVHQIPRQTEMGCETNGNGGCQTAESRKTPMNLERRTHTRTNLRVPIFLLPKDRTIPIRTYTENIGIDGFFCSTEYLFSPGDRVRFLLFLPPAATEPQSTVGFCVQGEAEVTRVSIGAMHEGYGVGCGLRAYKVVPDLDVLSADEEVVNILQSNWF